MRARPARARLIEDYGDDAERDDEFAEALMLRHGIPRDVVTALRVGVARVPRLGRRATVDAPARRRRARSSSRDRTLRGATTAPATRPRTRSSTTRERAMLLGGDHLIKHISSNPLISRPLGGESGEPGDGRPHALITYLALAARDARDGRSSVVLPGPRRAGHRPRAR